MGDDPTDDLLKEIASKHGVALGREDPLLIVQTMHARLLAESRSAQQAMLDDYRTTLEGLLERWSAETKAKAERIVTASLTATTETMKAQMANVLGYNLSGNIINMLTPVLCHRCLEVANKMVEENDIRPRISFCGIENARD